MDVFLGMGVTGREEAFMELGVGEEAFRSAGTVAPKVVLAAFEVLVEFRPSASVDPFLAVGRAGGAEALVA